MKEKTNDTTARPVNDSPCSFVNNSLFLLLRQFSLFHPARLLFLLVQTVQGTNQRPDSTKSSSTRMMMKLGKQSFERDDALIMRKQTSNTQSTSMHERESHLTKNTCRLALAFLSSGWTLKTNNKKQTTQQFFFLIRSCLFLFFLFFLSSCVVYLMCGRCCDVISHCTLASPWSLPTWSLPTLNK